MKNSQSLVDQLIYNELTELTDTLQQMIMRDTTHGIDIIKRDIEIYKIDYPTIYNEVIEADFCRYNDI